MQRTVIVLGAGMVGVSCGLALQQRGFAVTLIDRMGPGRETSSGNAGVLSRSSIFPINGPTLWRQLPGYATNRKPALRWRASLLAQAGWLARFLGEATRGSLARRSRALDALIRISMDANRRLIAEAGLASHLRETGWLKAWREPVGGDLAHAESEALAAFGIESEVLDHVGTMRLEPDAANVFNAGLLITGSASVDDPGAVVAGYARLLAERGGELLRAEARSLLHTNTGWRVETGAGSRDGDAVVVALGPWSADLLATLGYRVPMFFERGYHVHLATTEGRGPRRAIYDVDGGYVASPMRAGVRVTSGIELAARSAVASHSQIDRAAALAAETFGLGARIETNPWLGARPTLPDCLPMIGLMPGQHSLYAAFGHQHIGFSTGAGTGEIIAALIAEEPPPIDATPFDPGRYV